MSSDKGQSTGEFPSFWKARYDFEGNPDGMQLSFRKGETFLVTCLHEGGWFTAERNRRKGYVPSNYLERIDASEALKGDHAPPAPTKEMSEVLPPRQRSAAPTPPKTRSFSGGPAVALPPSLVGSKAVATSAGALPVVPPRRGTRGPNTPNLMVRVPTPGSVSPSATPPGTPPGSFTGAAMLSAGVLSSGPPGSDAPAMGGGLTSPVPSPSVPVSVLETSAHHGEGQPPPLPSAAPTQFRPPPPSARPPIPLRPDQGELACDRQESSPPSESQECDKDLLLSGVPFIRHVKKGKPSKKIVALDASCAKLLWKDYEKKRLEGFIMLDDIIATKQGHVQKKAAKVADPELTLSIICSDENKTLELEAESRDMRDRWLRNFEKLLLMHSKQRLA